MVDFVTYQWVVFLHIFGVFVFLLAHGVSSGVGFRIAKERNRERLAALLDLSGSSYRVMLLGFWWTLLTGLVLGSVGGWWVMQWFWAEILTLIVLAGLMTPLAGVPNNRVRKVLGLRLPLRRRQPPAQVGTDTELSTALEKVSPIPSAAVGIIGLGVLLWLMIFKPF